jgi:D-xylose reductase
VAQVLLRWATQRGIAVIPKSNNHDRLLANLQCDTFDLPESDIKRISALNINLRVSVFRFLVSNDFAVLISHQLNDPTGIDQRLAIFA